MILSLLPSYRRTVFTLRAYARGKVIGRVVVVVVIIVIIVVVVVVVSTKIAKSQK